VVVPNATLFTQSVVVNTAFPVRRSEYDLVVPSSLDIDALKKRITTRLDAGVDGVSRSPAPQVLVLKTDVTNTTLRVSWWAAPRHQDTLAVQDRVLGAVREEVGRAESREQEAESSNGS
jgi:small-conductance mechanosensitive channel